MPEYPESLIVGDKIGPTLYHLSPSSEVAKQVVLKYGTSNLCYHPT